MSLLSTDDQPVETEEPILIGGEDMEENAQVDIDPPEVPQIDPSDFPSSSRSVTIQDSTLLLDIIDTPRLEADLKSFLQYGSLPSSFERPTLMQYIQRLKVNAALQGNYDEANQYTAMNAKFYQACISEESKKRSEQESQAMEDRYENTVIYFNQMRKDWTDKVLEAKQEEEDRLKRLYEKHRRENLAFEKKWKSERAILPFSKPSYALQDTLYKHKMSVLTRQFPEANAARKHSEELTFNETQYAQERAQQTINFQRTELQKRQEKELAQYTERATKRLLDLQLRKKKEVELAEKHVHNMSNQLIKREHPRWTDAEIMCQIRCATLDTAGQLSPRSHQKMLEYRKSSNIPILKLRPLKRGCQTPKRPMRILTGSPQLS